MEDMVAIESASALRIYLTSRLRWKPKWRSISTCRMNERLDGKCHPMLLTRGAKIPKFAATTTADDGSRSSDAFYQQRTDKYQKIESINEMMDDSSAVKSAERCDAPAVKTNGMGWDPLVVCGSTSNPICLSCETRNLSEPDLIASRRRRRYSDGIDAFFIHFILACFYGPMSSDSIDHIQF